ncbi:hypothetical protein Tco_0547747 [Tanacetum coccineum]
MADEGPTNMNVRRVIDDLISFSENAPPRYMRFFLVQKVAESRRFVNRMRDEAGTARDCVAQLTALIAEFQAMEDQEEVHDSLLAAKDAKRGEEAKLVELNDVIAEALDEIETLENNVEILDGTRDDIDLCLDVGCGCCPPLRLFIIVDWCSHLVNCMLYYAASVEGCSTARLQLFLLSMSPFFILDKLGEAAESPRLPDKMRVAFTQARNVTTDNFQNFK